MLCIRASLISLGGSVLASFCLVLLVILWIATHLPERNVWLEGIFILFGLGMVAYVIDGASESLSLQDQKVVFDGWLTRKRVVPLQGLTQVRLVHEGLNTEWGIETLTFVRSDGDTERLCLGPLWRRRDLEVFLTAIEKRAGVDHLVQEVR